MQSQRRVQIGIEIGKERALCVRAELPQTLVNFNVVKVEDESFDRISSRSTDGSRSNDRLYH